MILIYVEKHLEKANTETGFIAKVQVRTPCRLEQEGNCGERKDWEEQVQGQKPKIQFYM